MVSETTESAGLGFRDVAETQKTTLEWTAPVPEWLKGCLFRNGPGRYNRGKVEVNHWFDGLALLHSFEISPVEVSYQSRFVRSHDYRFSEMQGEIASPGFACDPCRSLFRKVASAFVVDATDNPNVNIIKQGDRFLALTELPQAMIFDPESLRSQSVLPYRDKIGPGSTTAHPHQDGPWLYNHVLQYSAATSYRFYHQKNLEERIEFAKVPVREASYVHSFGLSKRHVILACCPFQVPPWKLLVRNKPFIENFSWKPENNTQIHVIPRPGMTGSRRSFDTEAFFCFHHVNSFEEPKNILNVDLIAYQNADIIDQLKLKKLRAGSRIDFGRLRRYQIDLNRSSVTRAWESQHRIELPRFNYGKLNGQNYRFVFGVSAEEKWSQFYDRLVKIDVTTDKAIYWQEPGTFPGEPIFVPRPGSSLDDQGLILSVVLAEHKDRSFLLLLDAENFSEIARVWLPGPVPHGFHGLFELKPQH